MVSLYKCATPSQLRILRIVEGAVRNAAHGHPEYNIPDTFARSAAKRAAGTLTAQWPDVLAAKPSEKVDVRGSQYIDRADGVICRTPKASRASHRPKATGRGSPQLHRRSPLPRLIKHLSILAGDARRSDNSERLAAIIEILRIMDKL